MTFTSMNGMIAAYVEKALSIVRVDIAHHPIQQ